MHQERSHTNDISYPIFNLSFASPSSLVHRPSVFGGLTPLEHGPRTRAFLKECRRPYLDAVAIPYQCNASIKRSLHSVVRTIKSLPCIRVYSLQ
jgi:hypothetical protein